MSAGRGSVALWMWANEFPATAQYMFGHSSQAAWENRIQIYTDDTTAQLNVGLGDQHETRLNIATLAAQQWYHLALTWDGTNYAAFVNGTLRASGSYAGLSALAPFADVGNDGLATSRTAGFIGLIDDVRLYNRPLTAAEVALLATPIAVPTPPVNVILTP
jgi:hypothetical protein